MTKFVLFFILPVYLFSVELIPQKIILTIPDQGTHHNMELFLQKSILSKAKDIKDIYIFSDDNTELKGYNLSKFNVKLMLTILKEKNENFVIEIFDITKEKKKLDLSISFEQKEFLKDIDIISSKILDEIKRSYPPKEKEKLIMVETEKKKLSEYEKYKPSFSISCYFNLDSLELEEIELFLGQSLNLSSELKPDLSFSPQLNLEFEWMWFLLIAKARMNTAENFNYILSFSSLFGFFNNLFFIGPFFSFTGGKFGNFEIDEAGKNIFFPGFYYSLLNIGCELRFNITKNYYLGIGFAFLRPYSELYFYYNNKDIRIPINYIDGPPYIFMNFNIKILEKLTISMDVSFYFCSLKREFNNSEYLPPVDLGIFDGQNLYLKRISIKNSTIGIGVKYEF